MYTFRYPDFHLNLYLLCCVPPSSMQEIFFPKRATKKSLGENLWRGMHGGTNYQIIGGAKCIFQ